MLGLSPSFLGNMGLSLILFLSDSVRIPSTLTEELGGGCCACDVSICSGVKYADGENLLLFLR